MATTSIVVANETVSVKYLSETMTKNAQELLKHSEIPKIGVSIV